MVVVLLLGMVVAVAAAAANPSRAALGLLALPRRPSRLGDALGTPTTLSVLSMRPRRELRRTGRMLAKRGAPESSFSRAAAARRLRTRRRRGAGSVAGVVVVVRCHESSSPPARVGQMLRLSLSLSLSHAAAAPLVHVPSRRLLRWRRRGLLLPWRWRCTRPVMPWLRRPVGRPIGARGRPTYGRNGPGGREEAVQVLRRLGLAAGAHVRRRNRLLVDSDAYAARFVRRMLLLLLLLLLCGGSSEATRRAQVTLTAVGSAASEGKEWQYGGERREERGERREERGERREEERQGRKGSSADEESLRARRIARVWLAQHAREEAQLWQHARLRPRRPAPCAVRQGSEHFTHLRPPYCSLTELPTSSRRAVPILDCADESCVLCFKPARRKPFGVRPVGMLIATRGIALLPPWPVLLTLCPGQAPSCWLWRSTLRSTNGPERWALGDSWSAGRNSPASAVWSIATRSASRNVCDWKDAE